MRLEELEARWVPATVQFNAANEIVNGTAGTFSIPVTEKVTPIVSTFATGFNEPGGPNGLAFDAAGNLYVANFGNNTVSQVTPAGVVSTYASGLTDPLGLAFDAAGNLFVADSFGNTVSQVTPAGVVNTFATGFNDPRGLAFDAGGNLYVTNYQGNTVSQVTPAGVVSTFASGFNGPAGLAFDGAGNLYVANFFGNTVSQVTPAGVVSTYASGLTDPLGLAFDAVGNLFVANSFGDTVSQVTPAGVVSTFDSDLTDPEGLAFDAAGNLYVAGALSGSVSKVTVPSVSVPFILGGTAMAGTDYSGVTASPLVIPTGQTTANITGTLLANPGSNQTLTLTLGTPNRRDPGSSAFNILTIRESVLTVQGTSGNDTFSFVAGSPSQYTLNGVTTTVPADIPNVVFVGNGGTDHAEVYGSGNDTATLTPTVVTDIGSGSGYTVELDNVAVANVHSSGANSTATFTLGAGDTFVGRYDYSEMVQPQNAYYLGAVGFAQTTGNALVGSNSEAWMETAPTSTSDSMTGTPTSSTIQGPGYSSTAHNFGIVAAFAGNTSSASATLSTTTNAGDILGGVPTYSFVQSATQGMASSYTVYAVGFNSVTATGSVNAIAFIATSTGTGDTYVGTATTSEVKGATYDIKVLNFGRVRGL